MNKNDLSIVLSGEAGKGIHTLEALIIRSLRNAGYHFFSTSEVMSRIRGGNNTTQFRIGHRGIRAATDRIDILLVLNKNAITRIKHRLSKSTIIIGDERYVEDEYKTNYDYRNVSPNILARESGGELFTNIAIYGLILGIIHLDIEHEKEMLRAKFLAKGTLIVDKNILALTAGNKAGIALQLPIDIEKYDEMRQRAVLSGNDIIGYGALAGGCNFIASYPMSPGTGLFTFLAQHAKQAGVVVEQAEDEIAAINMGIGAWYAGARAVVTTSGGGFALMEEGISLSGIIETPIVIHNAQRPGPATGLPTRTEQGDLLFAVFSGHGDFPKIVLAPSSPQDGIEIMHKAFVMADKYKVPVIVLTDQYYLDSNYSIEKPDFTIYKTTNDIVKTEADYLTYKVNESGISPRGIPGFGDGMVCVDSDEHDESGHITEEASVRVTMADKRMCKINSILNDSVKPEIIGASDYDTLIVGWGSTSGAIIEVLEKLALPKIAFACFKQLWPLPIETESLLRQAKKIIAVENNMTAQLSKLITMETGIKPNHTIVQYNGFPFSIEHIEIELKKHLKKEGAVN